MRELLNMIPEPGPLFVFDSGSTDRTLEIARKYDATIVHCEWKGYVGTKQASYEHASGVIGQSGWVLCLDSDESADSELCRQIADLVRRDDQTIHGARVNRRVWVWGKLLEYAWQPEWRLRLIRTSCGFWTGREPHDYLQLNPGLRSVKLYGNLKHDTFVTFEDMLGKMLHYGRIAGRAAHAQNKETGALRVFFSPAWAFMKHFIFKRGFLDGPAGLLASAMTTAYTLMKHIVWYELQITGDQNLGKQNQ
jgi:glycosyltransferase involved in cell wall biosynthesis